MSVDELIAFVIRSAYDKFPHALRLDEFFFDADDGVGGIPVNKSDINSFFKAKFERKMTFQTFWTLRR